MLRTADNKRIWHVPALALSKMREPGSLMRVRDLRCPDSTMDPDFHDGYTPIRVRRGAASCLQPRPRFTIVVTDHDEAKLRVLLKDRRRGQQAALASCLEVTLSDALVVTPHVIAPDIVTMNSHVLYQDGRNGRTSVARLVYSDRTHGNRVPVLSPLGVALLGARAGQTVMWSLPNRQVQRLRVMGLPYQPERSGDYHL